MKKIVIILSSILTLASLASCGSKEHEHSYNTDNIDWCFVPDSSGGYSASATLTCTGCAAGVEGHEIELPAGVTKETVAATCVADGTNTYTASITLGGKEYSSQKVVPITKTGHDYATSWSGDNTHHYHKCKHCDDVKDKEVHYVSDPNVWKTDGAYHYHTCEVCGLDYDKTYHTLEEVAIPQNFAHAATCTTNELYYKTCSVCGAKSDATFEKPGTKLGHLNMHKVAEVPPTSCTIPGMKEHYECDRCGSGHYYVENTTYALEVPKSYLEIKVGHDMVEHLPSQPTCDTDGNSKTYYTCTHETGLENYYKDIQGNEKYESKDEFIIPMTGHDFLENGTCTKCSKTLATAYGLSPVSGEQASDEIIFKSNLGTTYGKKAYTASDKVNFPEVRKEGYLFAGWFNTNGKSVTNGSLFNGKDTYTAYFVEDTYNNAITLSDYGYPTTSWWDPDDSTSKLLPSIPATATRQDIYFLFDMQTIDTSHDSYVIFDFGCNQSWQTAMHLRIRTKDAASVRGYFYGAGSSSTGGAGSAGTDFDTSTITYNEGVLLIHIYEIATSNTKVVTTGFDIVSIKNGTKYNVEKSVTFIEDYNPTNVNNNKFQISMANDYSTFYVKDLK